MLVDDDHRVGSRIEELGGTCLAESSPFSDSRVIRQPHAEDGAGGGVFDPDAPAVGLDGELAERESEPAPAPRDDALLLRVDLHERVEDLLAHLRRNAVAGVGDADLGAVGALVGGDRDGAVRGRVADRVLDEVREDAPEEVLVGAESIGLERRSQRHLA